ncbi:MAG: hypothetical protein PHT19_15410 [Methylococcus sp.]|nr:hypothetical protein [Methylococcus sp.]
MKTKGIQNAINRLAGARRLGSASLLLQAEQEAEHILAKAREWLARSQVLPPDQPDERYTPVALAVEELEKALEAFRSE